MREKIIKILVEKDKVGAAELICGLDPNWNWEVDFGNDDPAIYIYNSETGEEVQRYQYPSVTSLLLYALAYNFPEEITDIFAQMGIHKPD